MSLYSSVAILILIPLLVFKRNLINNSIVWLIPFVLLSFDLYSNWLVLANHEWVMWYWSIVLLVASVYYKKSDISEEIMKNGARQLLIIIMLVAVAWKVTNPAYLSGSFFERTMISNPLFENFSLLVGDLTVDQLRYNQQIEVTKFTNLVPGELNTEHELISTNLFDLYGVLVSWWVLLIELLIGVLFLLKRQKIDIAAHWLHILFIITTYFAVPIVGFGWILIVLGFALTQNMPKNITYGYFVAGILMCLYGLPL